jgi:hypothetical protein
LWILDLEVYNSKGYGEIIMENRILIPVALESRLKNKKARRSERERKFGLFGKVDFY